VLIVVSRKRSRALKQRALDPSGVKPASPLAHMPTKSLRRDVALLNALTVIRSQQNGLDRDLRLRVREARRAGASWERIAAALGVSRQACEKRWGPYPVDHPKVPRQKPLLRDEGVVVRGVAARRTPPRGA
jgi:hypothetical protein